MIMKSKSIVFDDLETLVAYIGEAILYMRNKEWDCPEHFYELIEAFVKTFPNHEKQ